MTASAKVIEFDELVKALNKIIFGSETETVKLNGIVKPTISNFLKSYTVTKADVSYVNAKIAGVDADIASINTAIAAVTGGHKAYATLADAQASQASLPANTIVEVTNDSSANNGTYLWNGTTLTKSNYDPLTQSKLYTDNQVKYEINKSLSGDALKSENRLIYSPDGLTMLLVWNDGFFCTDMAVKAGDWYLITSKSDGDVRSYYVTNNDNVVSYGAVESNQVFVQIPVGANRLVVNCLNSELNKFSVKLLSKDEVKLFAQIAPNTQDAINIALSGNVSKTENQLIYSLDGVNLRTEWHTSFFWSDLKVKEGERYLITAKSTGDIVKSYYTANGDSVLSSGGMESNQVFVQIPVGANRLVVNSLIAARDDFSVKLLSSSEVKLFEKLAPASANVIDAFPQKNSYTGLLKQKCPKFFNKLHNKTGDLVVVMSGTSLTQGNLYTSNRTDASSRPPLLHTNDLASHIFDTLKGFWHGQKYLRYDHPDVRYYDDTEWVVSNDIKVGGVSIWDDRAEFKNGLTKTSISPNARVSAVVPVGAWQFNFIYRSDSQGANCVVDVYEGNGKIEVFNGTNWVEANSYSFSMLESVATNRKGNTCYQKRLKMRCKNKAIGGIDSLATVKNITISKGANSARFNVVGFEWSPREFMFTLINGARGSHNWGSGTTHNLENYQDTDIWEFKPDLILCEATTINWGGGWGCNLDPNLYVNYAKRSYYDEFADNPLALKNTSGNFENCEVIFYGDVLSTHGGATQSWNNDKTPRFGIVTAVADNGDGSSENLGRSKTVFENYEAVETYMQSKPNIFIPVVYQFKELAERFYGNYPDAFVDSWTSGGTLTFDTTHLNDNGAAFWAHLITPLFENI